MQSYLQKRIKNYLDATGLSVSALERKAGLKVNVARNILRGQSKKPTAVTLQAIASVMNCTVQDLLGVKLDFPAADTRVVPDETVQLTHPDLLDECLHSILRVIKANNYNLSVKQTLLILEEVYAYTLKKDSPAIDKDFVEWFVKRTIN